MVITLYLFFPVTVFITGRRPWRSDVLNTRLPLLHLAKINQHLPPMMLQEADTADAVLLHHRDPPWSTASQALHKVAH